MADNVTLQPTPATPPTGTRIATRSVTYSGESSAQIAPVGLVAFSGSDDGMTVADLPGDASNGLDVDVTRVSGTVMVDSELPDAATLQDATANPILPSVGAFPHVWNGTTWDRAPGTAGGVLVDLGGNNDVVISGSVAATQTGTWSTRMQDGVGNPLTSKAPGSERALTVAIVDGAGNQVTSFTGSGGTSIQDDAAFTVGSASLTVAGGLVTSDAVDSGDAGAFAMLANRQQKITLYDSAGVEVAIGGGTQYDEDTAHTTAEKLTMAGVVRRDTPASSTSNDGDRTSLSVSSVGRLYTATTLDAALPTGSNVIGGVTQSGSWTLAANSGIDIGDVTINNGAGANAVNVQDGGNSLTVDGTVAATQSGTWNIGTVTTVSSVASITTSLTPGTSSAHLGKAEDAPHSNGDTGVMLLGVRNDAGTQIAGTDLDYCPMAVTSAGVVKTTGDISSLTPGTSGSSLGKAEDAGHSSGDTGVMLLAVRQAVSTDLSTGATNGDYEPLQVDGTGRLWTDPFPAAPAAGTYIPVRLTDGTNFAVGGADAVADTPALTTGPQLMGYAKATVPTDMNADGDTAPLWTTRHGSLNVVLRDAAGAAVSVAGGTQYTEDDTAAANPIGTTLNLIRDDSRAGSITSSNGDNLAARGTNSGELYVKHTDSIPVTNTGTFAVQVSSLPASTSTLEVVGDVAHDATIGGNPLLVGAYASSSAPSDVSSDGDAVRLWALRNGALTVQPTISGTLVAGGAGSATAGTLRTITATDDPGVAHLATIAARALGAGTTSASTLRTVSATDDPGVTHLATLVARAQGAGTTSASTLRVVIASDDPVNDAAVKTDANMVAHDAADAGSSVKVGAKAVASLRTTTLVAAADRTDAQSDLDGASLVRAQFPLGDLLSETVSDTAATSAAFTNFSAVASTRNYITALTVFRTDAGTSLAYIDFRDGTGGAVLYRVPLPPNGGSVLGAGATPYFRTSANTALAYDVSSALTTVYISISGFQSKV